MAGNDLSPINNGHQIEFFTAVDMMIAMLGYTFNTDNDPVKQLYQLNPNLRAQVDKAESALADLYQAIGNCQPWLTPDHPDYQPEQKQTEKCKCMGVLGHAESCPLS